MTALVGPAFRVIDAPAIEGAAATRETHTWTPALGSPDRAINGIKEIADARGRDMLRNTGMTSGAVALHKDSIIGSQYRLNATPAWRILRDYSRGFDEEWAQEFADDIEAKWRLCAEEATWLDAQRINTFTGMLRLVVGVFVFTGEVVSTAEWYPNKPDRPFGTAIQLLNGDRLCNPNDLPDTRFLRRGVERNTDGSGEPVAYHFRLGDRYDAYQDDLSLRWRRVEAYKPWGRQMVIHIQEQAVPDQSRGIADMVAALKEMRMTKKFTEVTLQNAVVNATYAAAIESELPPEVLAAAMGQTTGPIGDGLMGVYHAYMQGLSSYLAEANNIRLDGAMIPHLFPGTKLNLTPAKTAGGVGTGFEESLHRHIAAALGLSYESYSRDFSKTNYSSGRMAVQLEARFMASRKRHVADNFANSVYALWLEEQINAKNVILPRGVGADVFYAGKGIGKKALCLAKWLGGGGGQIDELRETQAALLRIQGGISTWEDELARFGKDWREVFAQRAREDAAIKKYGLLFDLAAKKPTGQQQGQSDSTDPEQPSQQQQEAAA